MQQGLSQQQQGQAPVLLPCLALLQEAPLPAGSHPRTGSPSCTPNLQVAVTGRGRGLCGCKQGLQAVQAALPLWLEPRLGLLLQGRCQGVAG
jgi:hypothetical protein